ncbi:MAG: CpaD family pilus assembly protein [Hyphomonadaceae bacterium]
MSQRFAFSLAAVSMIALGACAQSDKDIYFASGAAREMTAREVTAELRLDTASGGDRLADVQRDAVRMFAAAYSEEGHGPLVITRPSSGPNDVASLRSSADARAVLLSEGLDHTLIVEGAYDAAGAQGAPLLLSYQTWEAGVVGCPTAASVQLSDASSNDANRTFGCAVSTNLAAMLANPADAVRMTEMTPGDAGRRMVVFEKYRAGEKTGAKRDSAASGAISQSIGN